MENENMDANIPMTQPVQHTENQKDSNKMVIWFLGGLILIVALVGGTYLYLSRPPAIPQQQPIAEQTPAPSPAENLESDVNSINADNGIDSDFSALDQDLQQL